MLDKGYTLTAESGRAYKIDSLLSHGTGQGDVYKICDGDGKPYALKLFYSGDEESLLRQINVLINRGKACGEFVSVTEAIRCEGRIGYVMEYIPDSFVSGGALYNGIAEGDGRVELPFNVKLSVLYSLANAVSVLYNAGLAMADLKFDNFKFDPESGAVKIFDTDTIVCSDDGEGFIDGTVGFMPPLTMRGEEKPSRYNDSYALAVIIFMTLMGSHPLIGRAGELPRDNAEEYMLAASPVYVFHSSDESNRPLAEDVAAVNRMKKYPAYFGEAMRRSFEDGIFERELRTSPSEWCEILEKLYSESFCCAECGEEQFVGGCEGVCDYCGQPLVVPLFAEGDKGVPLFLGSVLRGSDLWNNDRSGVSLRVVPTLHRGKYGFVCTGGAVKLRLGNGGSVEFAAGKTVPFFLDCSYEINGRIFKLGDKRII